MVLFNKRQTQRDENRCTVYSFSMVSVIHMTLSETATEMETCSLVAAEICIRSSELNPK